MKANLLPNLQSVRFEAPKSWFMSIFGAEKSIKSRFFDLKFIDSHSFDGFKCATENKSRKNYFQKAFIL